MFKFKNIINELFLLTNYRTLTNILENSRIKFDILIKHLNNGDIKHKNFFGKKIVNQRSFKNFIIKKYQKNYIHEIIVDDFKFRMSFLENIIDEPIFERIKGKREPSTVAILKSLIKEDFKILELGACYGYFTIIMSQMLGELGQIISIECLPRNFKILQNNIKINDLRNVKALNYFISSQEKSDVYFKKNSTNPYELIDNLKNNTFDSNDEKQINDSDKVESIELSKLCDDNKFIPDLIFMDVEGFEADIIEELSNNFLKKNKPIILFEIHNDYYDKTKNLEFIKLILAKNNYTYRQIEQNLLCYIK